MKKLEYIYQIFNTIMVQEIDSFWEGVKLGDPMKLEIDYENLEGIAIYIVLKSEMPILLVDIMFIESFVSKAILLTNRAYHMTVLHSAITFIEENISNYYENKHSNPIKEKMTPNFNQHDLEFG